jgi:hypothetical protein
MEQNRIEHENRNDVTIRRKRGAERGVVEKTKIPSDPPKNH